MNAQRRVNLGWPRSTAARRRAAGQGGDESMGAVHTWRVFLPNIPWLAVFIGYSDSESPNSLSDVFYVRYLAFSVPQIVNCPGLQKLRVRAGLQEPVHYWRAKL